MSNLYTVLEASKIINVSPDTIRRWEKKGLIKADRSKFNYRLFNIDELQRIINKINGNRGENNYKILKAKKKSKYSAIELFAGAGGTALGFDHAGF